MKKIISILLAAAMVMCLLSGCSTYTDSETTTAAQADETQAAAEEGSSETEAEAEAASSSADQEFIFLGSGPVTLNPILSQSSNDGDVFYLIHTALLRMYQDEVEYDAAESVDVNDDYTEYTFHLRDCTFADGTPITAEMFEYSFWCALAPEMGSPNGENFYMIEGAEDFNLDEEGTLDWDSVGIKATDDKTLVITLAYPDPDFVTEMAADFIVPLEQEQVESLGTELGANVDNIHYSGPYILTEWVLNSSMTFVKNENYWNAENEFPVQTIKMLQVDDANTKIAMFENGEADAIQMMPSEYLDYLSEYVTTAPGNGVNMIWCNGNGDNAEVMSNTNFLLALSYAVDREAIMNAINPTTRAAVRVVDSYFMTDDGVSYEDAYPVDYVGVNGDTEKAQEYLAAALEELGMSDVSELPTLTYVTYENSEQKLIAEALIDQWKQVLGVNVQLEQYVIGTAIGMFYTLDFDMFDIGVDSGTTVTDLLDSLTTGGSFDNGCFSSEEFDELVQEAKYTIDKSEKMELVNQAEQILLDSGNVIPVFFQGQAYAAQHYVENYVQSVIGAGWQFNYLHVNK